MQRSASDSQLRRAAPTRIVVSGWRDYTDYAEFSKVMHLVVGGRAVELIAGDASGADAMTQRYAREHALPFTMFPADWRRYGKGAGPIRNCAMVAVAQELVAFQKEGTPGTQNAIDEARKAALKITVVPIDVDGEPHRKRARVLKRHL